MKRWLKFLIPAIVIVSVLAGSILGATQSAFATGADTHYWVGGTGNYNDTTHWSHSSGGAGSAGVPGIGNTVIFDNLSDNAGGFTVTINIASSCAGWTSSAVDQVMTIAGTFTLNDASFMVWKADHVNNYTGAITFSATSGPKSIDLAGKSLASAVTFNGAAGSWQLDNILDIGANILTLTNGILNTNGKAVTSGNFVMAAGTKTLTLGATTWTSSGNWTATVANTTLDANTSVLIFTSAATQFTGGALTYNEARFNGSGAAAVLDANSWATLTRTGTATPADSIVFSAAQIISGTVTFTGNSLANRLAVKSNTTTARSISAAVVTETNADFYYIQAAGASAPWNFSAAAGGSADMGGNIDITSSPDYWVAATGNWTDATTHWSGATGGTPHANFLPVITADVFFDASSFTGAGQSVTINGAAVCRNMVWTGVTNTPTIAGSSTLSISGILTTVAPAAMLHTYTGTVTFSATSGTKAITFNGLTWDSPVTFNGVAGTWQNADAFNNGIASTVTLTNGTWDTNDQTITLGTFTTASGTNALDLGSSTVNVQVAWTATSLGTLTPGTSNIVITALPLTFVGAGKTYYNLSSSTAGTLTITGANTFANLTRAGTAVTTDNLTLPANATTTITGTFTVTGNSTTNKVILTSSNSPNQITTINAAVIAITNTKLSSITATGASAPWELFGLGCSNGLATPSTLGSPLGLVNINLWAADAYWVGGSGGWDQASVHWSASSGGAPNASYYPGYNTNVHADVNSFSAGSSTIQSKAGIVAVETYNVYCNNFIWTGATNNPSFSLSGNADTHSTIFIYGNATFISTMTFGYEGGNFSDTAGCTFDSTRAGVSKNITLNGATFNGDIPMTYSFYGDHVLSESISLIGAIGIDSGTLTATNLNITCSGDFAITSTAVVKGITLGTGNITCYSWSMNSPIIWLTITGNYSIIMNGASRTFAGNGFTYYNVNLTGATQIISGANTFHNLTRTGTAIVTESFVLNNDQIVTNILSMNGISDAYRMIVQSNTAGTQRSINVAISNSINHVEFLDFNAAGSLIPWNLAAFDDGTVGNVSNITFPAPNNHYWVGESGTWNDNNHWANSSGGAPASALVPLTQDLAKFDAQSFNIASRTVTLNLPRYGNINTVGVDNNPIFSSAIAINNYGILTLEGIVWNCATGTNFVNRSDVFLTTGNITFNSPITMNTLDTTVMLAGAFTTTGAFTLLRGTFMTAGYTVTSTTMDASTTTNARSLDLGASTWILNSAAAGTKWNVVATSFTFVDNTSLLYLTNSATTAQTFAGGGLTNYNDIIMGGNGIYTLSITGNNTFRYFVADRAIGDKTIAFANSSTTTVTSISSATSGANVLTLKNASGTTTWTLRCTAGVVYIDYLLVQYNITTGGATFYSGTHSAIVDGLLASSTGIVAGSPVTLYESVNGSLVTNTPNVTTIGNLTATMGSATLNGIAATHVGSTITVTASPKTLNPGANTVGTGGTAPGLIDITVTGSGWNPSVPTPPAVTTNAATAIGSISVTGNATVISMGAYPSAFLFFQVSLTGAFAGEQLNGTEGLISIIGSYNQLVTGLSVDTPYFYRAALRYNGVDYVYGSNLTFTTSGKPEVSTGGAANITMTTVVLQGSIVAVGIYPPDYVFFQYSTTGAYAGEQTATLEQTFSIVTGYQQSVTGLYANTLYHFRAACRYVNITALYVYGTDVTFNTTATEPVPVPVPGAPLNSGQSDLTGKDAPSVDILDQTTTKDTYSLSNAAALTGIFGYQIIHVAAVAMTANTPYNLANTEMQLWYIATGFLLLLIVMGLLILIPGHQFISGLGGVSFLGLAVSVHIYPWWVVFIGVIYLVATIVAERSSLSG